jgi:hypothetical protein
MSTVEVWLDGYDVTNLALEGSSTRRLNRPSQAQVKLPMQDALGGPGSRLQVYVDSVLHHHGTVLLCETEADEETGYTVYNSTDPLELWQWRPVRDPGTVGEAAGDPGDFSDPSIIRDYIYGPQIVEAMMDGSEGTDGDGVGVPPDNAEGPLFLDKGTFEAGSIDLTGVPVDWPMRMSELASLLISTGEVDIVITPIELDVDGNIGQIDVYNGNYGLDLSTSVVFEYGLGQYNIRRLRFNEDMSNMANKIWYYLGPRLDQQHWRASIWNPVPDIPTAWSDCGIDPMPIVEHAEDSQDLYGIRMEVKMFDGRGDEAVVGKCLYRRLWIAESWIRAMPQQLLHITPTRDTLIGDFDIGDIVGVDIHSDVRGGLTDFAQRVYEYTISWDQDSVPELSELVTSAQNEGF